MCFRFVFFAQIYHQEDSGSSSKMVSRHRATSRRARRREISGGLRALRMNYTIMSSTNKGKRGCRLSKSIFTPFLGLNEPASHELILARKPHSL